MADDRAGSLRPQRFGGGLLASLAILGAAAYLAFTQALFNDGDTSWHLAAGELILDTRSVPSADPFSFTFAGAPWTAHEWLAEVAMAAAFRAGGWAALAALFTAAIAIALALIARELLRSLAARYALLALALVVAALAPFMLARPHVLTWPMLALWLLALMRARDRHRAPAPGWALVMLVWANLHASYLFGLGLAAAFALEALLRESDRRSVMIRWSAFGILSFLLALVTPHGLQGLAYPLQVSGMKVLPLIQEWRSSRLPEDLIFFILLAGSAAIAWMSRRELSPVRIAVLAIAAAMAVLHARHQPLFVIIAAMILPRVAPTHLRAGRDEQGFRLGWLVAGVAAVALVRLAVPLERESSTTYPAEALARLPDQLRGQPVLNSYGFGGPLILHGIRPYIDGRADMYGDDFTAEHHSIVMGDRSAFDRAVARFRIRWTILEPGSPLIAVLDRDPRWRRVYSDRWAVVHVRR